MNHYKADIALLGITFIWGVTFVIVQNALTDVSPFVFLILRFFLASIILALIFFDKIRSINKQTLFAGSILGFLLMVGYGSQTAGLIYTTVSKSAFITGISVILVPVFVVMIERIIPKLASIIGVIFATAGLYLMTFPEGSEFNFGDALTLICAVSFAFQIIFVEIYTKKHDFIQLAFIQVLATALFSIPSVFLFEEPKLVLSKNVIWAILITGILATALAFYVQLRVQRNTTATRAAIIFVSEPIFAALTAYFYSGEVLGWLGVLGGGLIIAGILISELGK